MDQFLNKDKSHFFSKIQVKDTLMSCRNDQKEFDIDKTMVSLRMRFEKGTNFKKKIHDEVEKKRAEEAKLEEEKQQVANFNKKMNGRVEKEMDLFEQLPREVLNQIHPVVDYGV